MNDWKERTAREVMSSPVTVIQHHSSLEEALQVITDEQLGALVAVDVRGHPVGVLSKTDVAAFLTGLEREADSLGGFYFEQHLPLWERIGGSVSGGEQEDLRYKTLVSDVMTPEIVQVDVDASLERAVEVMRRRRIHRVIVTHEGHAVGVVTTMDVLDALAAENQAATP